MRDKHPLAWSGRAAPERSGGMVDGVGLNEPRPALAVDPDGVAIDPGEPRGPSGPQLAVERMPDEASAPVQRNGRVRMTRS